MTTRNFAALAALIALVVSASANAATTRKHKTVNTSTTNLSAPSKTPGSSDETFGLVFGPGIANGNVSAPDGYQTNPLSTRTRMDFGAFYEHRFIKYFSLRPELDYVQRGFSVTDGQGADAIHTDLAANYLEVPILAKGQYPLGVVTPYVVTGPVFGLLTGSGQSSSQGAAENDTSLNMNSFNFGWAFGGGSSFKVSQQLSLEASVRYMMGFTNTYADAANGFSYKLNDLQVLAGVGFTL